LACDFLLRWPTLEALRRARPQTIRKFYHGHNCRRGDVIEDRLEEIRTATPLTSDPAIVETSVLTVQMLARQIRLLGPSIARYEEEIETLLASHPDVELFNSLPGAGAALVPRLLAALGSDRDRFHSATEVQQYTGIAPVTERSGKKTWVHWRWAAPTFLRQTFHEFAGLSIQHSAWARAFYDLQRERGKNHHAAVRSLAFKRTLSGTRFPPGWNGISEPTSSVGLPPLRFPWLRLGDPPEHAAAVCRASPSGRIR
jgi:transposase